MVTKTNLFIMQKDKTEIPTHKRDNQENQLDYIAGNVQWMDPHAEAQTIVKTDHKPLTVTLELSAERNIKVPTSKEMLKADIQPEEIKQVLNHQDWPRRPFNQIARSLNLTRMQGTTSNDIAKYTKLVSNAENLDDIVNFQKFGLKEEVLRHCLNERTKHLKLQDHFPELKAEIEDIKVEKYISMVEKMQTALDRMPKTIAKKAMQKISTQCPKEFFKGVKAIGRFTKKGHIVKAFRKKELNEEVPSLP